jgi:anti-sigma factor RsiW
MSCPEFEKYGFLYLSGELSPSEYAPYEDHLKTCALCREELEAARQTINLLDKLPSARPSSETRKAVLLHAHRKKTVSSPGKRSMSWIFENLTGRRWALGLSTAAVAVILLLMVIRPFDWIRRDEVVSDDILAWEDDFIAAADWMESEIDRVESGALLADYTTHGEESEESDTWLSPMSEDIDWIRGKVEDLVKTIYGI